MKWKNLGSLFLLFLALIILFTSLILGGFDKLKQDIKTNSLRTFPVGYIKEIGDGQKISMVYKVPESNIMPNEPLYLLKKFRDNLWIILSKTPKEKSELYLLMADKRMYETIQLIKKQENDDLVLETLADSVYNLEKAKETLGKENKKDIEFFKIDLRINQAGLAYEDILKSINYKNEKLNPIINELENWNQKNKEHLEKN